jgi:WD40 repeat protein
MAPRLPAQQLVVSPDKNYLVLAINSHLQLFDRAAGTRRCSTEDVGLNPPGSNHSGLIRLLLIHQEHGTPEKGPLLISTGEDKLLKTWQLPDLKLLHSRSAPLLIPESLSALTDLWSFFPPRQLIKRATSIAVSPNGKNIVIADKFGDVYEYVQGSRSFHLQSL